MRSLLLAAALAVAQFGAPVGAMAADLEVVIDQHMFMPAKVTIHPGDKVTWINKDGDPHSVLSDDRGKTFHSEVLDTGQSFSLTFARTGTFGYYCGVHPYMQGSVVVQ
ncbi:MAG: plastocyanin/azurin family copper-binding protein [Acetobacteraceae bacterium]